MKLTPLTIISALLLSFNACLAEEQTGGAHDAVRKELPFVVDFEPARYLGKWYEVARLPVFIQPAGTLAVAEYSAAREEGKVIVKNTAYNAEGKVLATVEGEASIAAGAPPGRLLVRFGPAKPAGPNYFVMHVDKDYQYTVV